MKFYTSSGQADDDGKRTVRSIAGGAFAVKSILSAAGTAKTAPFSRHAGTLFCDYSGAWNSFYDREPVFAYGAVLSLFTWLV